jgi:hypothetical protein
MSLVPGAKVLVTDYSKFDGNLYIQINDSEEKNVLGSRVTSQIFVNLHP